MNFHSYGNIFIHPFNYMSTKHKYPINAYQDAINFYETFKKEVAGVSDAKYGNAMDTVEYKTDGEASDWMLGTGHSALQSELVRGWAHAAREMAPLDAARIDGWMDRRLAHIEASSSSLRVGHDDVAGVWRPK